MSRDEIIVNQGGSLSEVLDRVIDTGVVLQGDATISVADVQLIYLGLRLVLCSADRVGPPFATSTGPAEPKGGPASGRDDSTTLNTASSPVLQPLAGHGSLDVVGDANPNLLSKANGENGDPAAGIAQLVLALVELLRQLMEKQAVRRMERGTVNDQQIDQLGETFMRIEETMTALKAHFNLTDEDLNLDLGPLGHLLD